MTCGPLVPSPSTNLSSVIEARDRAVIARTAGERDPTCAIAVPSVIRSVLLARYATGVNASNPHVSPPQALSTPSSSTSRSQTAAVDQSSWAIPKPTASFTTHDRSGSRGLP